MEYVAPGAVCMTLNSTVVPNSTVATAKPSAEFYVLDTTEYKCHLPGIPLDDDHPNASDFVSTELTADAKEAKPLLFALDCEMCRTTKGVELTRITLVDADEKVGRPLAVSYASDGSPTHLAVCLLGPRSSLMSTCVRRIRSWIT